MEPLDFLGGKYEQAEQILPGAIQTFRAHDSATGRPVFVHRISLTDEPLRQSSLLGLLSSALLRSPKARKMVVDVEEADGFYYVVTQTAPQCLLLREWLQCEVDDPSTDTEELKQTLPKRPVAVTQLKPVTAEAAKVVPAAPEPPSQHPGEFTRIFQAVIPVGAEPAATETIKTETPKPEPVKSEPAKSESGDFTRFFREELPAAASAPARIEAAANVERPASSERQRIPERPLKTSYVQRPNTPVPGEFTRLFSPGGSDAGTPKPQAGAVADAGRFESDPRNYFERPPEPSSVPRGENPQPGEYTRIFKSASTASPLQEPAPVREQGMKPADESAARTVAGQRPHISSMPAAPKGPSEYSRIMKAAAPPAAPALPKVKMPSTPSVRAVPAGAAAVAKNKLILFFVTLGVLAIALIVLFVLIALRK